MKYFLYKIIRIPILYKKLILIIHDAIMLLLSLWISFSLRLGEWYNPVDLYSNNEDIIINIILLFSAVPVIFIPIFNYFGLYRAITRYIGLHITSKIIKADVPKTL